MIPTSHMRYVKRKKTGFQFADPFSATNSSTELVLQQLWTIYAQVDPSTIPVEILVEHCQTEWRDIPIVEEPQ